MRNKSILAATLALPLLLLACDRAEQSPTAAVPSQEKQAMTPQDKMLQSSPPAAGAPASADTSSTAMPPAAPPTDNASPAAQPSEPRKAY